MADEIYVPFPRKLYDDLIRFSDGKCDPVYWAVDRLEDWIDRNFSSETSGMGWASDNFMNLFADRIEEFAEEYHPSVLKYWEEQDQERFAERSAQRRPLFWKGVSIAHGSEVRMSYGGLWHYAQVHNGKIKDDDGERSPSEWASKVACGTSRSAWRDLWFKAPGESTWAPAMLLRDRYQKSLNSHSTRSFQE